MFLLPGWGEYQIAAAGRHPARLEKMHPHTDSSTPVVAVVVARESCCWQPREAWVAPGWAPDCHVLAESVAAPGGSQSCLHGFAGIGDCWEEMFVDRQPRQSRTGMEYRLELEQSGLGRRAEDAHRHDRIYARLRRLREHSSRRIA